ncbi:MAG: hypothetical protein GEU79_12180 [Acidimicrobiia bacterium]|nr:hypothetical protein [Acidimicrobiia bacterium]
MTTDSIERADHFLSDQPGPIPWQIPDGGRGKFEPVNLFLGQGSNPLEVAIAVGSSKPNVSDVRQLWKRRKSGRPAPLLLIALYPVEGGLRAATCGPVGDDPAVLVDRDVGQVERIAATALAEPGRNAAIRFLADTLSDEDDELPGLRNSGMFATHQLVNGVPNRSDWSDLTNQARPLLAKRGQQLVTALGFEIDQLGVSTSVLRIGDSGPKAAVAVFLNENETPEGTSQRFASTSPISKALAQADIERLPYVVLTRGSQIRIYSTRKDVGVGRKGRAETFIEANLALLPDDKAGYVPLIFGANALRSDGTFTEILDLSKDFAAGLGERLRDRIYKEVVPELARIVIKHSNIEEPTEDDLNDLYEMAMVVLFRLLFVAYAEDKDLLPYRENGRYQRNALKTLARDLADLANEDGLEPDPVATSTWDQIRGLWRAVDEGNSDWAVPPYNGGMFSSDPAVTQVGARLSQLEVTNAEVEPALLALLVDRDTNGVYGPVDFRSLSVREFGTIYEGLLESNLAVARTDLTTDSDGTYIPATDSNDIVVEQGQLYLHDRSGVRKATGSYFTKPFAVEHLLDHALDAALDDHLERLQAMVDTGEEAEAALAFFDFRVADIAMGSGHFLVAAVDHIETRLSSFLVENPIPGVVNELQRLGNLALDNLGELAEGVEIEQATLLRRQVARRCIYGVDLNVIAVELARLGMWIHTFVPGLPLSFLDHSLVQGNSLTGIGTLDEAVDALVPEKTTAGTKRGLRAVIGDLLEAARPSLRKLAQTSDASAQEIKDARAAHFAAREAVDTVRKLFDLACAVRLGEVEAIANFSEESIATNRRLPEAELLADDFRALHYPIAFPEVFLRDNPGFDCVLGNPPWEKVKIERHGWWALRYPGLRSLPVSKQNSEIKRLSLDRRDLAAQFDTDLKTVDYLRAVLVRGPYPGMGTGDPDLYKAFAWRFWDLIRDGGAIGVVLPRSAMMAAGSGLWRQQVIEHGRFEDTTMLLNRAGWVFDDAEHRYTIGLVAVRKGEEFTGSVSTRGPYASLEAYFKALIEDPAIFSAAALSSC